MAETTINGRDGTADFSIAAASYRTKLREFSVESNVAMLRSDVFSIEGVSTQDPGMEQLTFRIVGLGKKGVVNDGPLIPCPQGVAVVATFSTGCTISCNVNFTRATATRTVNENTIITGEAISNGAFTVAWVVA